MRNLSRYHYAIYDNLLSIIIVMICSTLLFCPKTGAADESKIIGANRIVAFIEDFLRHQQLESYKSNQKLNINEAVDQVQGFLEFNSHLQKLTRGEIYNIVKQVSKKQHDYSRSVSDNVMSLVDHSTTQLADKVKPDPIERPTKINIDYSHLLQGPETTTKSNLLPPLVIPDRMKHILNVLNLEQPVRFSSKYTLKPVISTTPYSQRNFIAENVNDLFENLQAKERRYVAEDPQEFITNVFNQVTTDVKSYQKFKPLPTSKHPVQGEMKKYLASFGLLDSDDNSRMKSSKSLNVQNDLSLPNTMQNILNNIGLLDHSKRSQTKVDGIRYSRKIKRNDIPEEYTTTEEISTETFDSPVTETIDANNGTMTEDEDEAKEINVEDLESSFGGGGQNEESSTSKPHTGFFYFVNWNSFLKVGEDDEPYESKVDLKFNPKKGDPSRFLPSLL